MAITTLILRIIKSRFVLLVILMPMYIHHMQLQIREEDEEIEADGANYQLEMMRCLREVNVDNNTVGW